ncbi:hypothetical protein EUX98_g9790 [Antrodiella citrinella]|uniref:Uncharacterized protein n=1 Tax=Antrodiella citrinella TaxID=2447956 RepID=A0A4S4LKX9_9APHY|nr:hypothetical protein EUX98_g9790 [Antrodiella citrinella]
MQLNTLTLISGSFALQFFAGILYPDSDLDLYVEHLFAQQVVDFLLTDGYRFQPTAAQLGLQETLKVTQFASPEPYGTSDIEGIGGVLTFKKDNGQTVQLIVTCQGKTAIEVILNFHSIAFGLSVWGRQFAMGRRLQNLAYPSSDQQPPSPTAATGNVV